MRFSLGFTIFAFNSGGQVAKLVLLKIEQKYAHRSSVDSRGNCVYVTDAGSKGLGISDCWDAVFYDNED